MQPCATVPPAAAMRPYGVVWHTYLRSHMSTSNRVSRPGQPQPTDHPAVALCIPLFHDDQEELLCAMLLAATSKQPAHAMYEAWCNWGQGRLPSLGAVVITTQRPAPADTLLVASNALLLGATVGHAMLPRALQRMTLAAREAGIEGDYVPGRGMVSSQSLLPACFRSSLVDVPTHCSPTSSVGHDDHDPPEDPALPSSSAAVERKARGPASVTKAVWRVSQDVSTLVYADPALEALYVQQSLGRAAHARHSIVVVLFAIAAWHCWSRASTQWALMVLSALCLLAASGASLLGHWYGEQCARVSLLCRRMLKNTATHQACARALHHGVPVHLPLAVHASHGARHTARHACAHGACRRDARPVGHPARPALPPRARAAAAAQCGVAAVGRAPADDGGRVDGTAPLEERRGAVGGGGGGDGDGVPRGGAAGEGCVFSRVGAGWGAPLCWLDSVTTVYFRISWLVKHH